MVRKTSNAEIDRVVDALQDSTRRGILLSFYSNPVPRTVDEVAQEVGVHRTVAFSHLERLAALGYLSTGQRRGRLGKPAKLYHLEDRPIQLSHPPRHFARLASLLASGLRVLGDTGTRAAREAGYRHGASLIARRVSSVEAALDQLAPLGAAYSFDGSDVVVANNCVFREACEVEPEVICQLHAGLLEGALQAGGIPRRVDVSEHHDSSPRHCAYRLTALPAPEG